MRFNVSLLLAFTALAIAGVMADDGAVPSALGSIPSVTKQTTDVNKAPLSSEDKTTTDKTTANPTNIVPSDGDKTRDKTAPVGSENNPAPTEIVPIGGDKTDKDKTKDSDPLNEVDKIGGSEEPNGDNNPTLDQDGQDGQPPVKPKKHPKHGKKTGKHPKKHGKHHGKKHGKKPKMVKKPKCPVDSDQDETDSQPVDKTTDDANPDDNTPKVKTSPKTGDDEQSSTTDTTDTTTDNTEASDDDVKKPSSN